MTRRINLTTFIKIKQWEGLKLSAYQDVGGVWTIGYGSTGPNVKPGMTISRESAEELLKHDLDRFEKAVDTLVKVKISDNQFGALVSFAFNVGVAAFKKSTLLRKLNAGDYDAVPTELMRWNKAGGRVIQGLVNRRAAEAGLWASGSFVTSAPVIAKVNKPAMISPENIATGGAVISSIATASSGEGPMQWAFAAILVLAAVVAAIFFIKRQFE